MPYDFELLILEYNKSGILYLFSLSGMVKNICNIIFGLFSYIDCNETEGNIIIPFFKKYYTFFRIRILFSVCLSSTLYTLLYNCIKFTFGNNNPKRVQFINSLFTSFALYAPHLHTDVSLSEGFTDKMIILYLRAFRIQIIALPSHLRS